MGNPTKRVCETCRGCALKSGHAEKLGFPRYSFEHPDVVKLKIPLKAYEGLIKKKAFYCLRYAQSIDESIQKHTCPGYNERLWHYRPGVTWDPEQGFWRNNKGGRSG